MVKSVDCEVIIFWGSFNWSTDWLYFHEII